MPSVSVVIPALDAADAVGKALQSIHSQDYQNVVEVIVATGDAATAGAAEAMGAKVLDNPTGSTPAGLNLAIAASQGEVVVRCDAQATLPPGYIRRAVETMQRTGAINVGGMQVPVGETYWERAIAAAMSSPLGAGDARYRIGGNEGPAETVYLGVYDKEAILELGGFDEQFARNQDYELNHRIIKSGGVVWFDLELGVEYRPRGSLGELGAQYFQYGQAKRLFARRHPGSLRWRQLAPPLLVGGLLVSIAISPWWPWSLSTPLLYVLGLSVGVATMPRPLDANPGTVLALLTMHTAWGSGFLVGRRSRPSSKDEEWD